MVLVTSERIDKIGQDTYRHSLIFQQSLSVVFRYVFERTPL